MKYNLNELEKDEDYNKNYSFTSGEDYTHAILMNKAMPSLRIPRENVIGLAFEPREFLNITSIICLEKSNDFTLTFEHVIPYACESIIHLSNNALGLL